MNRFVLCCVFLPSALLSLTGCPDASDAPRISAPADAKADRPHDADAVPATATADNTAVNGRDRDGGTLTPFDQSESARDIEITAQIRRAVVGADNLGANAENVKIITSAGVVTLRGPVASAAEKASVEAMAVAVAGVNRVDNQLDVQPQ